MSVTEPSAPQIDQKKLIKKLKRKDRFILFAVAYMQGDAYGVPLAKATKYGYGTIYTRCERLEAFGLIESEDVPGIPARGVNPEGEPRQKRVWKMTDLGVGILQRLTNIN